AQDAGAFVGNLFLLLGRGDRFVTIDLQDAEPRLQRALAHGKRRFFAHLMALVAGALFGRRHGRGTGDIGLLALPLLAGKLDRLVALGALAREAAFDLGDLGLARLADQGDLAVAAFLFERQLLLHLGDFPALGLGRKGDIALGAQLFERLLVLDFALLHRQPLIEHERLLFAELLGLLVGDLFVLTGACYRFLALDFKEFKLGGKVLVADRHRRLLFGRVHLAAGFRGDFRDNLETFGVEHVVGAEIFFRRLLERDDRYFFQRQP